MLVATEAAGEGINLQFCWLMINYDIPWNPVRLEQRSDARLRLGPRSIGASRRRDEARLIQVNYKDRRKPRFYWNWLTLHVVRAITLLETLLPASGDSRPESATTFSTSPFTSSTPGHFRGGTASRRWIPMPRQKTRCSELFSAVLRKKHRVLAKKHDAPND